METWLVLRALTRLSCCQITSKGNSKPSESRFSSVRSENKKRKICEFIVFSVQLTGRFFMKRIIHFLNDCHFFPWFVVSPFSWLWAGSAAGQTEGDGAGDGENRFQCQPQSRQVLCLFWTYLLNTSSRAKIKTNMMLSCCMKTEVISSWILFLLFILSTYYSFCVSNVISLTF